MNPPAPSKLVVAPTISLSAVFLCAGGAKLAGLLFFVDWFRAWDYPDVLRLLVGAVEITGAIALLIPRVASVGAIMLGTIMVGAIYTLLFRGPALLSLIPLGTLALLMFVGNHWLDRAPETSIRPSKHPPSPGRPRRV
jgi:putative oxidoreductase